MNSFYPYFAPASMLIALISVVYLVVARQYVAKCCQFVTESNKRSLTIKKLTDIEVELTEHADSIAAIHKSMHKLRSRIHGRTVTDKKSDGAPDPTTDPLDWKRYMNAQLAEQRKET